MLEMIKIEHTLFALPFAFLGAFFAARGIPRVGQMGWILLANPSNGLYNVILRNIFSLSGDGPLNIYSLTGMILVSGLRMVPAMYLMISGTFSRLDPALEEASDMSGDISRRERRP